MSPAGIAVAIVRGGAIGVHPFVPDQHLDARGAVLFHRRMRAQPLCTAFVVLSTSFPRLADAAPCDSAREAWTAVDQAVAVLESGRGDPRSAVAPLLAATCAPSGADATSIRRARDEAALLEIDAEARAIRADLARAAHPPPTARNGMLLTAWQQQQDALWRQLSQQLEAVGASVEHLASADASLRADAYGQFAMLNLAVARALAAIPLPPALEHDANAQAANAMRLEAARRVCVERASHALERAEALSHGEAMLSRDARRARAWLAIEAPASADTNVAPVAASASPAPSAAPSPPAPAFTPDVIRAVVQHGMEPLTRCYEQALAADPNAGGRVTTHFVVGPDGAVASVALITVPPSMSGTPNCIDAAIRTWHFPPLPNGGSVTIDYPFDFRQ